MAGAKFDSQVFFGGVDNVAALVSASELFGLFRRSFALPLQWAALVRRTTGEYAAVRAGDAVDGTDAEAVLLTRATPFDVVINDEGVVTRDKYRCRAEMRLRLSIIPERSELVSFQKAVLGSHRVVQIAGMARYLQPALRAAIAKLCARHDAADLVDGTYTDAVSTALTEAVEAPCFAAGLVLDGPPSADFHSQTLRQVQDAEQEAVRFHAEHQAGRQVQEALELAQTEHLDHLASLLTRLKELACASPDADLSELIRTFSEQQRGELYQALFASEPVVAETRWVVVAAGDELMFIDPHGLNEPARRLTLSGPAGPPRSVWTVNGPDNQPLLLVGAATGVYRWPIDRTEPDLTLIIENAPPVRGGFNGVAAIGDRIIASHSELGLCEWNINEPTAVARRFESMTQKAKAVRGIQFFGGDLYCAIDNRIIRWPADEPGDRPRRIYTGSITTVTALCPASDDLFAGNGEGDILYWPKGRDTKPDRLHTGLHRPAESIWLLSSHGVRRLVYTDTTLHVHARVLGDSFTCRYEGGGQTLRRVEVAPDLLVATNELRDRLICWTPGQPAKPSAVVHLSHLCGHTIQDVCLVPRA
jgi:hypothetical protein